MAIVKNLATVKTTADITSSATSIPVNRVNVFGDAPFYVTIMPASGDEPANLTNSEIVLVTGISGTNLNVTRGQRGTTAKAFNSGAIVTMGIYAEDAVFLGGEGSTTNTTAYEKKLVDKDGNTIIPIIGYMGTVYTATLSSATAGGRADYEFTPDTPIENNKVYAVMFPAPTVNNATIILGDGVVSGSILVPPVAATDSPNYELLTTDMINNTEPLLLMYSGVQWVCLNQKKKVATADLENKAVKSGKIDWATFAPSSWATLNKTYGCYYAKYGNIVFLHILFRDVAATSAALGTLRADCCPTYEIGVRNAYDNQTGLLYISTDGKVRIQWTGTAPSYFFATAVYPVDK